MRAGGQRSPHVGAPRPCRLMPERCLPLTLRQAARVCTNPFGVVFVAAFPSPVANLREDRMASSPQDQHRWLDRFLGDWTYQMIASMGPGKPPEVHSGRESVTSIGGFWVVAEAQGELASADHTTVLTLGFDPIKGRYIGTFVGSMMPDLWLYEGDLDSTGTTLTLHTEGPSFTTEGARARYRDVLRFESSDRRT